MDLILGIIIGVAIFLSAFFYWLSTINSKSSSTGSPFISPYTTNLFPWKSRRDVLTQITCSRCGKEKIDRKITTSSWAIEEKDAEGKCLCRYPWKIYLNDEAEKKEVTDETS